VLTTEIKGRNPHGLLADRHPPELQHHLDTYSFDGDGLVFVNEHGQPWHRGNFNPEVRWREAREQIGILTSSPRPTAHRQHTGRSVGCQPA
jgi:hypothetical protein